MAVICTVRAAYRPMAEPISDAGDQHDPPGRGDRAVVDEQDERGHARDHHAGHRHLVAAARGGRAVHQVQAEHEQGRGRHVDELDVRGEPGHDRVRSGLAQQALEALVAVERASGLSCSGAFRRNIFSIRSVTT